MHCNVCLNLFLFLFINSCSKIIISKTHYNGLGSTAIIVEGYGIGSYSWPLRLQISIDFIILIIGDKLFKCHSPTTSIRSKHIEKQGYGWLLWTFSLDRLV